jgi:hypothetical protein
VARRRSSKAVYGSEDDVDQGVRRCARRQWAGRLHDAESCSGGRRWRTVEEGHLGGSSRGRCDRNGQIWDKYILVILS